MANNQNFKTVLCQGEPFPLGVKQRNGAIHFSVVILDDNQCKLHLYKKGEEIPFTTIVMGESECIGGIFTIGICNLPKEEWEYTYEVRGKEFVDPCAKRIAGRTEWGKRLTRREKQFVRGIVEFDDYPWKQDVKLTIPYHELILYRLHVRGFTKHASANVKHNGTFLGLREKIPYLKKLGINAVELMPVYEFHEVMESEYPERGRYSSYEMMSDNIREYIDLQEQENKLNYWGYSDYANYYAPKSAYAATDNPVIEFKQTVEALHKNGIEVILEMYFKGGTNPVFILECMRYWVLEFHVDGFHFSNSVVPTIVAKDPFFADIKLITEGWNTYEVYQERVPRFKNLAECNEEFQTVARRFLKGDEEQVNPFSYHFRSNPEKCGKINYITNNNGFTMMDLYSYDIKHNEANGEENRDGTNYNYSWNCGIEGVTRRKKVVDLRQKQIRNAFLILLLNQGTPLIYAGDEFGNTQQGNNNAYCQDNEISWLDWNQRNKTTSPFRWVQELIRLRKLHPILHKEDEMRVMDYISCGYPDLSYHGLKAWYPDYSNYSRVLGIMLCGRYAKRNRFEEDDFFYFMFNMHWETQEFDLPDLPPRLKWVKVLDTMKDGRQWKKEAVEVVNQNRVMVNPRSVLVLISKMVKKEDSDNNHNKGYEIKRMSGNGKNEGINQNADKNE